MHAAFEARTVALLNRGVPSFAVEADGTLHTSLMRSCSGWPSGVWTTHERRSVPDGSNFQLQHWTHTFDYARGGRRRRLAAGANPRPQRGVRPAAAGRPSARDGDDAVADGVPGPGSLMRIAADGVHVDALKLAGNPTPEGSASPPRPRGGAASRRDPGTGRGRGHRIRCRIGQAGGEGRPAGGQRPGGGRPSACTASKSPPCWPN